jgi:hypothetical protein
MATVYRDWPDVNFFDDANIDGAELDSALYKLDGDIVISYPGTFDPSAVTSVQITGGYFLGQSLDNDLCGVSCIIERSGGGALAAEDSGGTPWVMSAESNVYARNIGSHTFGWVDTTATVNEWETARVRYIQNYSKVKGGDGGFISRGIDTSNFAMISINYTPTIDYQDTEGLSDGVATADAISGAIRNVEGNSQGTSTAVGAGSFGSGIWWSFDANQMTMDDDTNHTMDGYHVHTAATPSLVYRPNRHFLHTILR